MCIFCFRSLGTIGGTSEEDSDYACIDRSTHSITGYLQSPTKSCSKEEVEASESFLDVNPQMSTTSFIDSPSPYATISVMRKQKQKQANNNGNNGGRSHWNRPLHPFHTMKVICQISIGPLRALLLRLPFIDTLDDHSVKKERGK